MKLPLSWFGEFFSVEESPEEIAEQLTKIGIEVDGIEQQRPSFQNVVVGKIESVQKHPNADKLALASVFDGTSHYSVVCGAPNCREGLKIAFAKPGAKLEDEKGKFFKIKKTKIRGIESYGMCCSENELGLSKNHDGIIELPQSFQAGFDLVSFYSEVIFDISLTPNLNHCASVRGIARELSIINPKMVETSRSALVESAHLIEDATSVKINDKEKCPRYACRVIKNVTIAPSPQWMQKRLIDSGLRPINNVVDITNYVLLELGHPLHAFDYDKLNKNKVIIRTAEEGEKFVTLDDVERVLNKEDLLICDGEKPVAIAGVMGGKNSEVSEKTETILLESAYFDPTSIRRTSKRLGLSTDSSKRFERGVDPNQALESLDRAAALIQKFAKGEIAKGIIDEKQTEFASKVVDCRLTRVNAVLGIQLALSELEGVFQKLDFSYASDNKGLFKVTIPTYRVDISEEIDLIEEAARVYGYENFPRTPELHHSSFLIHAPIFTFERDICSRLISEGLQQWLTCDLISPEQLELVREVIAEAENSVRVLNPVSIEQSVLRPSLMPGILQVVKNNYDKQNHNLAGFEVGRIHFKKDEKYIEQSVMALALTGKVQEHHWDQEPAEVDFFDLKGIVENVLESFSIKGVSLKVSNLKNFHPGRQAIFLADSREIGVIGELHPKILREMGIPQKIYFAELNLHDLFNLRGESSKMEEIPKYPGSERDWTITLDDKIVIQEIMNLIAKQQKKYLEKVSLLDVYKGDQVDKDKKNVTFRFFYRDSKKTIAQKAVDSEHQRIIENVLNALD